MTGLEWFGSYVCSSVCNASTETVTNERPWAVGFGKKYSSILLVPSYMLYSIEREALLKARNKLVSSRLYRDRKLCIAFMFYAAALRLRFLVCPFVKWVLPWLPDSGPWPPRRLPSTTAGKRSKRARSCAQLSFMLKGDDGIE
jgi:hypothetical protein